MLEKSLYKYRELGLLILRLIIGIIFIIHGYGKIFGENGISDTVQLFTGLGIYMPGITAWLVALGELVGGSFIIIGFLTREFSLILTIVMAGAIYTVHYKNGFSMLNNGYEYNLALIGACLCLVLSGAGAGSLDKIIFPRARWTFISDPSKIKLEPPESFLD